MTLRLFHYNLWPDAQAARIALLEQGDAHEIVTVDMSARAHRDPAFLALNPQGEPPVLIDTNGPNGELKVWETLAVARYIHDKRVGGSTGGPILWPPDPGDIPPTFQWAAWTQIHLTPLMERMLLNGRIMPRTDRDVSDMRPALRRFRRSLELLEQNVPTGTAFMNRTAAHPAGTFSFADITLGATLSFARLIPPLELTLNDFPRTRTYVERLETRLSFRTALGGVTLPPAPPSDLSLEFPP